MSRLIALLLASFGVPTLGHSATIVYCPFADGVVQITLDQSKKTAITHFSGNYNSDPGAQTFSESTLTELNLFKDVLPYYFERRDGEYIYRYWVYSTSGDIFKKENFITLKNIRENIETGKLFEQTGNCFRVLN